MRLVDADKLFEKFRTTFPASEAFQILVQAPTVCDIEQIRAEIEELDRHFDNDYFSDNKDPMYKCNEVLQIIDKYR